MRALVISGGGSKGAFAGGVAEYLITQCRYQYDLLIGVSTGSLLVPLLALGEVDRLRDIYTQVNMRDIFRVCPFWVRRRRGIVQTRIHHLNVIRMFLRREKTFGDSRNLRNLIAHSFSPGDFDRLNTIPREVLLTVSNLSLNATEYKCQHDSDYESFIDWMWASANLVPFMSLLYKQGNYYADGGIGMHIPIQEAINRGANEIDAILLNPAGQLVNYTAPNHAFSLMLRMFDFTLTQMGRKDIRMAEVQGRFRRVSINFYYTPYVLTENPLIFDPKEMKGWWQAGYENAQAINPYCVYIPASPDTEKKQA